MGFISDYFLTVSTVFSLLPSLYQQIITVGIFMILIILYAIFIWKVYKTISHKDLISLNLQEYNAFAHPTLEKIWAGVLYFLEYLLILPFIVLFWYIFFSLALLLFSNLSLENILLLSAAVVGSIRALAYYKSEISAEIAKLLPLTILGLMMLSPEFLNIGRLLEAVSSIPSLLSSIGYALGFVVGLELILRLLDLFKRVIVDD